jgi:hypothetical protein
MAGDDSGILRQGKQLLLDGTEELLAVASG